jgi:3',5'-cyclic AMP phosphodiesterase CpdA
MSPALKATIEKINGLPQQPDFIIHTGDLSHTSKAAEFDTLYQVLKDAKPKQVSSCRVSTIHPLMTARFTWSAMVRTRRARLVQLQPQGRSLRWLVKRGCS